MSFVIEKVKKEEIKDLYNLVIKLAEYEKLKDEVSATLEDYENAILNEKSAMALVGKENGKVISYAIYFYNFSTFTGKKGIYLEDIFILKEYRNKGYGKKFFEYLIEEAKKNDCKRIDWACLNWNENSINFYKKIGAVCLDEWRTFRLEKEKLI